MNIKYFTIFSLLLLLAGSANASLLLNGDAETGDLSYWQVDYTGATSSNTNIIAAVTTQGQSQGTVEEYAGEYFFSFANQAASTTSNNGDVISMFQTGTSGLDQYSLSLTGMYQTESLNGRSDVAEAVLSVYDASDNLLVSATTSALVSPNLTWEPFAVSLVVPSGAASWKVELFGAENSTTFANVFYDNMELNAAIPEPTAFLVWSLLGGLGLAAGSWRRR